MTVFAELITSTDAATAKAEMVEALQANVEGWEPHPGNLDDWVFDAVARLWSIVLEQASQVGAAAFGSFGRTIVNVPPILAAPATVASTWTMIDAAGYTIADGTEVAIAVDGGESRGFVVVGDVVIAPGGTATAAGEVLLQAIVPGTAGNGLSADPVPISALSYIGSITLEGVTSGGVDEEDEDAYLDRLTEELQLLSFSLIISRDFEIDARAVAGITRALAVPGYKWSAKTEGNALYLTVFVIDAAGVKISAGVKTELQTRQAAKVPSGVTIEVGDPTTTEIDIECKVTALTGFTTAMVAAAVKARLEEYLSPAQWGISTLGDASNSSSWVNSTTLYRNELISVVDRVAGVGRVVTLKLAKGGGALEEKDVALTAPAPLTKPKTLTVAAE